MQLDSEVWQRRQTVGAGLIGAGGCLLILAPFLQWISVVDVVNVNLPQLFELDGYKPDLAYVACGVGVVILMSAISTYLSGDGVSRLGIGSLVLVGIVGVPGTIHLIASVEQSHGAASIGPGVIAVALAEGLFLLGASVAARTRAELEAAREHPRVERLCHNGHSVTPECRFCPTCGVPVTP